MNESVTPVDSLHEFLDHVRGIKKSEAFTKWKGICDSQIDLRTKEVLQPCGTQEELIKQEYMKGEVAGMMAAVKHWEYLEETLQHELNRLLEESGNVEGSGGTP